MKIGSQSAIEFLMTYWWAILLIVGIGLFLFDVGVFDFLTVHQTKATAGSCFLSRPFGKSSQQAVNYVGLCQNAIPKYVAQFSSTTANIAISGSGPLYIQPQKTGMTIDLWFMIGNNTSHFPQMLLSTSGCGYSLFLNPAILKLVDGCGATYSISDSFKANTWYNLAVAISPQAGTISFYSNGTLTTNVPYKKFNSSTNWTALYIGNDQNGNKYLNGSMANVQLYNSSLSANDIKTLYQEGIGGAPIDTQSIEAWWPLNGNTNDYSGNGNNGPANMSVAWKYDP